VLAGLTIKSDLAGRTVAFEKARSRLREGSCRFPIPLQTAASSKLMDRARAQEENARILLDGVPAGIVVVDEQGNIKLVNASTERLFGYKQFELLDRNVEVLGPDGLADMQPVERNTFLQKPEARAIGVRRDLRARRRDGSEFPVEIGLSPVNHNGGSAVLATITDLSERKRAQQRQHARPATGTTSPGQR